MIDAWFLEELRMVGALKVGHFLLASGLHSEQYVEKFELLRRPGITQRACTHLIELAGELAEVDLVVGPTTGGILLAFEAGRQLGLPAAYAERASDGSSSREFKRGTVIAPGTRVLLVDDVLTTGGSVRETLKALRAHQAYVRGIAVLVDRSGGQVQFDVPHVSLAALDIATYGPDDCTACQARIPLVKPGSTAQG